MKLQLKDYLIFFVNLLVSVSIIIAFIFMPSHFGWDSILPYRECIGFKDFGNDLIQILIVIFAILLINIFYKIMLRNKTKNFKKYILITSPQIILYVIFFILLYTSYAESINTDFDCYRYRKNMSVDDPSYLHLGL